MNDEKIMQIIEDVAGLPIRFVSKDDARKFLKGNARIRINPVKVSQYVNDRLWERFNDVSYLASSQRVHGLLRVLANTFHGIEIFDSENVNRGAEIYDLSQKSMFFSFLDPNYFCLADSPVHSSVDCVYPFFNSANRNGINFDEEFGNLCIQDLKEEFERFKKDSRNYLNRLFCRFFKKLETIDFEKELLKEEYDRQLVKEIRKNEITSFRVFKIYQNIVNSGEDIMNYQRQLLCRWLDETNVTKNIRDYKGVVRFNQDNLELRKRKLSEYIFKSHPKSIIRNQRNLIDFTKFIGITLESEREFVERYLGH